MNPKEESEKINEVKLLIEKLSLRASGIVGVIAMILVLIIHNNADVYQLGVTFFVIAIVTWVSVGIVVSKVQAKETEKGLRNTRWVDAPRLE